jgi:hypothetical protein
MASYPSTVSFIRQPICVTVTTLLSDIMSPWRRHETCQRSS